MKNWMHSIVFRIKCLLIRLTLPLIPSWMDMRWVYATVSVQMSKFSRNISIRYSEHCFISDVLSISNVNTTNVRWKKGASSSIKQKVIRKANKIISADWMKSCDNSWWLLLPNTLRRLYSRLRLRNEPVRKWKKLRRPISKISIPNAVVTLIK